MKKKLLSLALVLVIVCSLTAPTFAASSGSTDVFQDVTIRNWYYGAVRAMVNDGAITGYPDGTYRGDRTVTLAEFTTILARLQGLPCGAADGHWAGQQMAAAVSAGWLDGEDLALVGFDDPAPRELAAKLLCGALGLPLSGLGADDTPFVDRDQISYRYLMYVVTAWACGLFVGDDTGKLDPQGTVTRAAAATLIYRAVHLNDPISAYTKQEIIDYFAEVACHAEYDADGNSDGASYPIHKWTQPIYCSITGDYTSDDMKMLQNLMAQLNTIPGFPGIYIEDSGRTNMEIGFLPSEEMPGFDGYATIWWTDNGSIVFGRVSYRTDGLTQEERNPTLCEELIQALGMLNDSYAYSDSIFYQLWTDIQWPSVLDWKMVELLYDPNIQCGMTEAQIRSILNNLIP